MAETTPVTKFPWQPESTIRGNLAIGHLRENLLRRSTVEGRIHADTLLMMAAAIAGFSCLNAVMAAFRQAGKPVPQLVKGAPVPADGFMYVMAASGQKFYFGDLLNAYLIPEKASRFLTLWNYVAGAAIGAGMKAEELPKPDEYFGYVTRTIGTDKFGTSRSSLKPQLTLYQSLKLGWPFARKIIMLPLPDPIRDNEPQISEQHWPVITSVVAAQLLTATKDVVDPRLAIPFIMETAIAASKVDPALVPESE